MSAIPLMSSNTRCVPLPLVGRGWGWGPSTDHRTTPTPPAFAALRRATLPTRGRVGPSLLRCGVVEHAAAGLFVPSDKRVFRQHLPALAVAGAGKRDRHHAPAVEVGDRPHLHLQHEHVARAL